MTTITRAQLADYHRQALPDVADLIERLRATFGDGVRLECFEFTDTPDVRPMSGSRWVDPTGDIFEVRAVSDIVVVGDRERIIRRDKFPGDYRPIGLSDGPCNGDIER